MDSQASGFDVGIHLHQDEACVQRHSEQYPTVSNLWERLSASKFPWRHPIVYGSLLELRSFYHRIRLLLQRGDIRYLQMGPLYEQVSLGHLVQNIRTQSRTQDMQTLHDDLPWLSPEDCHLFLLGWDAGERYRGSADTAKSRSDTVAS